MSTPAMLTFVAIAVAFGVLAVISVGVRRTHNARTIGWGALCSGIASGALAFSILRWLTRGFEPLQAWVLPLAGLVLLLVMIAQHWFVFYADRDDLARSARPAVVALGAAAAMPLAGLCGAWRATGESMIWAGAISAAVLLSIGPLRRAIAANGSVPVGLCVGIAKLLVPLTGIVALVLIDALLRSRRADGRADAGADRATGAPGFAVNLLLLIWEFGVLLLVALTNGPRYQPTAALAAASPVAAQPDAADSATGEMPRSTRDTAILTLVVVLHLLGGLLLIRT